MPRNIGDFVNRRPARIVPDDYSASLETVPVELTQTLADLRDPWAVAQRWSAAEEWQNADVAYVQDVLIELIRLAREARTPPKELYLLTEW
jgi:hypothetical protein